MVVCVLHMMLWGALSHPALLHKDTATTRPRELRQRQPAHWAGTAGSLSHALPPSVQAREDGLMKERLLDAQHVQALRASMGTWRAESPGLTATHHHRRPGRARTGG